MVPTGCPDDAPTALPGIPLQSSSTVEVLPGLKLNPAGTPNGFELSVGSNGTFSGNVTALGARALHLAGSVAAAAALRRRHNVHCA